jgi:hypothetical protein
MSNNEGGDSRFMSGFAVGFVAGVLLCLGAGGVFLTVQMSRSEAARHEALAAEREGRCRGGPLCC